MWVEDGKEWEVSGGGKKKDREQISTAGGAPHKPPRPDRGTRGFASFVDMRKDASLLWPRLPVEEISRSPSGQMERKVS